MENGKLFRTTLKQKQMVVVGGGGGGGKFSDLKTSILYCENKTEVFTKNTVLC